MSEEVTTSPAEPVKPYPEWKRFALSALNVFFTGFLVSLVIFFDTAGFENITWNLLYAAFGSAVFAGLNTLVKWLREKAMGYKP
jgi:prepilin signal peptidase PulO-like enzyme (type II secretory pathway)